jgi:hypothetical protein
VKPTRCLVVTKALSGSRSALPRPTAVGVVRYVHVGDASSDSPKLPNSVDSVDTAQESSRWSGLSQSRKGDGLLGQRTARSPR